MFTTFRSGSRGGNFQPWVDKYGGPEGSHMQIKNVAAN